MIELPSLPEPLAVWLIVAALASWRIASVIHREGILRGMRKWLGVREEGELVFYPDSFLGELLSCLWCLSVWTSLATTILLFVFPYILLPFAISSAVILFEKVIEHDR